MEKIVKLFNIPGLALNKKMCSLSFIEISLMVADVYIFSIGESHVQLIFILDVKEILFYQYLTNVIAYKMLQTEESSIEDLMELVTQIVAFHMKVGLKI